MKVYDSQGQCSAAEGVSLEVLKKAKRSGCPGFSGSRVNWPLVKKWIAEHEAEMNAGSEGSLRDEKLRQEVRKLKIKNDKDEGKLVAKVEVAGALQRIMGRAAPFLEERLVNQLPSSMAGLDVPQGRVLGKRLYDEFMVFFQTLAGEFPV